MSAQSTLRKLNPLIATGIADHMNISDLRAKIAAGEVLYEDSSIEVDKGILQDSSGSAFNYSILYGWDFVSAKECDDLWTEYNLGLLQFIEDQNYEEGFLEKVLNSLQTEDMHWNWLKKSFALRSGEYKWFFLYANNQPQGACVVYQPKQSALQDGNIFYVEFVAVAPWNRQCLIRDRQFKGVGSKLLSAALTFCVKKLSLQPGFSLHSLPQARSYYERLNMINVASLNKDSLLYFELPVQYANNLLEGI